MMGGIGLGQVLAVISGKGGTGKTSLCAGVALALAEAGQSVLCIDADVGLRNLDISLGLADEPTICFTDVIIQCGIIKTNLMFYTLLTLTRRH